MNNTEPNPRPELSRVQKALAYGAAVLVAAGLAVGAAEAWDHEADRVDPTKNGLVPPDEATVPAGFDPASLDDVPGTGNVPPESVEQGNRPDVGPQGE